MILFNVQNVMTNKIIFILGMLAASILQDTWCWKDKSVEVEVRDGDVSGISFTHTGYILKCSISHPITLVSTQYISSVIVQRLILECLQDNTNTFSSLHDTTNHILKWVYY